MSEYLFNTNMKDTRAMSKNVALVSEWLNVNLSLSTVDNCRHCLSTDEHKIVVN